MRFLRCIAFVFVCFAIAAAAQEAPASQPPLWSSKPDVAAFEKIENELGVAILA